MKRFLKIKPIWFICLLSFFSALWINQLNIKTLLDEVGKEAVRNGKTVTTNDDASYLAPAINFLETGVWKDNSIGKQSCFVRSPGYGFIYMAFTKISDSVKALSWLKYFQLLLFSLSIFWLFFIAQHLFTNNKWAYGIALIYGVLPFSSGFLFYTLTEGITPAVLLLYIYMLFMAEHINQVQTKRILYFLTSFCFSYLLLIRPALGLFGLLIPIFILKDYGRKGAKKAFTRALFFGLIGLSFFTIWQIRNASITKEYVGIHSIYYKDGNSFYRPTLKAYWDFPLGMGQTGSEIHSYMVPMWSSAIKGDTSITYLNNAINKFPKKIVEYFGKDRLTKAFRKYQEATLYQKSFYEIGQPMPNETPEVEVESINEFEALNSELKSKFWMDYYFISPAKVFKTMSFHSNLNLHIFQNSYRGNIFVEALRYLSFALHSLGFILLLISLIFINKIDWRLASINFIVLAYVFYLCFFQRGIEERYTLPILSLILIIGAKTFTELFRLLRR